jgi:hypothetical protein
MQFEAVERVERRRARADNAQEALTLQLAELCDAGHLDALVLAGADGLAIAHAGDLELCSELAAIAPLLSSEMLQVSPSSIQHGMLFVRAVEFEGSSLYLASCGEWGDAAMSEVDRVLHEATQGVRRILAA